MWWAKLFPSSNPPENTGTNISNWEAVAKKKTCKLSRDWTKEDRDQFLVAPYEVPQSCVPRDVSDDTENMENMEELVDVCF